MINKELAKERGLTEAQINTVESLQSEIHSMFEHEEEFLDKLGYKGYADRITELDYELQVAWGFPRDSAYHTYWFRIPSCKCPMADNVTFVGTDYNWINQKCPYHGNDSETLEA